MGKQQVAGFIVQNKIESKIVVGILYTTTLRKPNLGKEVIFFTGEAIFNSTTDYLARHKGIHNS